MVSMLDFYPGGLGFDSRLDIFSKGLFLRDLVRELDWIVNHKT